MCLKAIPNSFSFASVLDGMADRMDWRKLWVTSHHWCAFQASPEKQNNRKCKDLF
jgi:hypothetical protein